jgi:predicted Zn-dependent protease with MMP-like domain
MGGMIRSPTDTPAPDLALIETLAQEALAALPEPWRAPAQAVTIRVEDFPTDEMLEDLGLQDPFELTGLYDGVPLTEKSVSDQPLQPDAIWLFRRPILDEWADRGNVSLREMVSHVLVHELAHHFGWSDEDIARVDPWWE